MPAVILTEHSVSVSELKANPGSAVKTGNGRPVAVLNHNQPEFYCVPTELFESISELLDDLELAQEVRARANEKRVSVTLDEL